LAAEQSAAIGCPLDQSAAAPALASAGLILVARCVALFAGLRDGWLIARPSHFQLDNLRKAAATASPGT
jgi:modification methylase